MMPQKTRNIIIATFIIIISGGITFAALNKPTIKKDTRWSVLMADSEIKRTPESWMLDFSKKLKWNYCHGLVGKAMLDVSEQYNDTKYYDYILAYADTMIYEDGKIWGYKPTDYNIDRLNSGKILFRIFEKENKVKYKLALDLLRSQIENHPRTSEGGFWHKKIYPCQMWLDGLYMGAPFYAEYSKMVNDTAAFSDVCKQFKLVKKYLYDPKTGLYRHGWDECKQQAWADSVSAQSPYVWGRAVGWFAMALVDALDFIPQNHPERNELIEIFAQLSSAIANVQDKNSGVWYQIPDLPNRKGNYLESSCSTMFVYSLLKGVRKGYINTSYLKVAKQGYNGILNVFITKNNDGTISITDGCAVAGLGGKPYRDGSFQYYINEPIRDNDPKSVGPFIMASLEYERL